MHIYTLARTKIFIQVYNLVIEINKLFIYNATMYEIILRSNYSSHRIHNYDLPISYIAGEKYICILKLTFEGNASINHSK